MKRTEYEAFKYVIQDTSKIYVGAKYSYQEILDNDDVPVKLRGVIMQYMLKEVSADTTIENHIFFLEENQVSYFAYKQMKAKFKMNVWNEEKKKYESKLYDIEQIVHDEELRSKKDTTVVEEMDVKKLSLMMMGL